MSTDITPSPILTDADRDTLLIQLAADVTAIRTDIAYVKQLAESVSGEIKPTLDALTNHPMARMFLKGLSS